MLAERADARREEEPLRAADGDEPGESDAGEQPEHRLVLGGPAGDAKAAA